MKRTRTLLASLGIGILALITLGQPVLAEVDFVAQGGFTLVGTCSVDGIFRDICGFHFCEDYFTTGDSWNGPIYAVGRPTQLDFTKITYTVAGGDPPKSIGVSYSDWIRSVVISGEEVVVLYDDSDFSGKSIVLEGNGCYDLNVTNLDEKVSAARVFKDKDAMIEFLQNLKPVGTDKADERESLKQADYPEEKVVPINQDGLSVVRMSIEN